MFAEVRTFTDPQQHAGSIQGWQQVYDQLGRGSLTSTLWQVSGTRFQMFQEVMDKRVVQHGLAPKGRLCIALSTDSGPTPLFDKKELGSRSVVVLRDGEEFLLHSPEATRFFGVNVDTVRFAKVAALELPARQLHLLRTRSQIAVTPDALELARQRICPAFRQLLFSAADMSEASEKLFEDNLLDAFLDLFSGAEEETRVRHGNLSVSSYLVRKSQQLALDSLDTPLSVLDLCEALRVSRRTLQNSFQVVTGMRPVEYLRNLRLNAVRRRLMSTSLAEAGVGEIAGQMGFYHLSHFSGAYRELFGEYPSQTRRA